MVARTSLALVILGGLAGLATFESVTARPRAAEAPWLLVAAAALLAAAFGILARRWWGRWLGLAAGLTCAMVSPWVIAALLLERHAPPASPLAFVAGVPLLFLLGGRSMFQAFDAPAGHHDDTAGRIVRWAVVTNSAAAAALLFVSLSFVLRGHHAGTSSLPLSIAALSGLVLGVALLAQGFTLGLLVLGAGAVTVAVSFVDLLLHAQRFPAPIYATFVAPGFVLALCALGFYAVPIWRFLRRPG